MAQHCMSLCVCKDPGFLQLAASVDVQKSCCAAHPHLPRSLPQVIVRMQAAGTTSFLTLSEKQPDFTLSARGEYPTPREPQKIPALSILLRVCRAGRWRTSCSTSSRSREQIYFNDSASALVGA